ncbi:MAG: S1 RNA-binding domain-containing protein [Candidatus Atribacteria bacterium]|nr:S1 RNA-binding domain-containing protein [Candidatus Atribacteria bacterium]
METKNAAPESALQPKARLTGKVIKTTIAGAIVDIGQKVPGVIHISQLQKDSVNRVEEIIQVGQEVNVWVRRVHDDRVELTMVEPLTLEWRELKPDMVVKGKVSRLETYGAFVEIGAERPGLVHVSEISHEYVKNPSEVLKEGDEVEAKILDVDRRKKQIRLSIKAAMPKPEEVVAEVKKSEPRKGRSGKKGKKQEEFVQEPESKEPELTAFQIAFQKAQERADDKKSSAKSRKSKSILKDEQEEIFSRTLENRITPG